MASQPETHQSLTLSDVDGHSKIDCPTTRFFLLHETKTSESAVAAISHIINSDVNSPRGFDYFRHEEQIQPHEVTRFDFDRSYGAKFMNDNYNGLTGSIVAEIPCIEFETRNRTSWIMDWIPTEPYFEKIPENDYHALEIDDVWNIVNQRLEPFRDYLV